MNNCPDNHDDGDYGYAKGNWSGRDHRPLLSKLIEPFWHIPKSLLSREGIAESSSLPASRATRSSARGRRIFCDFMQLISRSCAAGATIRAVSGGGGRPLSLQEQPEVLELDV